MFLLSFLLKSLTPYFVFLDFKRSCVLVKSETPSDKTTLSESNLHLAQQYPEKKKVSVVYPQESTADQKPWLTDADHQ